MNYVFGQTEIINDKLIFKALSVPYEWAIEELWRLNDDVFDVLYHISTKSISRKTFSDFANAYLFALGMSVTTCIGKTNIDVYTIFKNSITDFEEEPIQDDSYGHRIFDNLENTLK